MKQNTKTKEMFIIRALEKILKDKDVRRKDNVELKKACESALGEWTDGISRQIRIPYANELVSKPHPLLIEAWESCIDGCSGLVSQVK